MFAATPIGLQHVDAGARHARHRHASAYAALVLKGGYEESGSRGRYRVREGQILLHAAFDGHRDVFGGDDARILNLPLNAAGESGLAHCAQFDAVVATADRDPMEAAAMLSAYATLAAPLRRDWPDDLVADLWRDPGLCLARWAARNRLSAETLSRGLRRAYGTTPAALRAEIRAQKAWRALMRSDRPLAALAQEHGFADQAHMTRAVSALTGRSPGAWRRQIASRPAA